MDKAERQFEQALLLKQDYLPALENIVRIHTDKKEYQRAIDRLLESTRFVSNPKNIYYNIACLYAIQHQTENSLSWLDKAISHGYDNWELIKTDVDLKNIRKTLPYQEFLQKHPVLKPQGGKQQ